MAQLFFGGFRWQVNTVGVSPACKADLDARGVPFRHHWLIALDGDLIADGAQALSLFEAQMEAQLEIGGRGTDLVLLDDNGRRTAVNFPAATAVTGVHMIALRWTNPNGGAGEYVTKRSFTAEFEAIYPAPRVTPGTLLSFSEALAATGDGGPEVVWQPAINGPPPTAIVVYPRTPTTAVQAGEAVGWLGYPQVPAPIWGYPYLKNRRRAVEKFSPSGPGLTEWRVRWRYEYEGDKVFAGVPSSWPGVIPGRA